LYLGSYGHYFSRWFTRFRGKHSLPEYHSLRHYAALNRMDSLSSSLRRYSGTQTLQLLITDTGKALMFRGWLNWWRLYRTKNYVSAKRRLNFLRSGSILRFWKGLVCFATAKRQNFRAVDLCHLLIVFIYVNSNT